MFDGVGENSSPTRGVPRFLPLNWKPHTCSDEATVMSALDRFGLDDAVPITGAVSGIGKGSATACADGADLALADVDAEGLEAVAAGLGARNASIVPYLASEQSGYITGQVIGVTGGIDLFSF